MARGKPYLTLADGCCGRLDWTRKVSARLGIDDATAGADVLDLILGKEDRVGLFLLVLRTQVMRLIGLQGTSTHLSFSAIRGI